MNQQDGLTELDIPLPPRSALDPDMQHYFQVCEDKLGLLPNVLLANSFDAAKLRNFVNNYNDLMLGEGALSQLEREMIAVVVSSINHCYYCLVSHGQSVRALSGDPILGEMLVMNYRVAKLPPRQRAMLDFAAKLTEAPAKMDEADRQLLRDAGFADRAIWEIAQTASFFNMTNRMSAAVGSKPNAEYHAMNR